MHKKIIAKNVMCSLILQIVTIISGFIIPKVILTHFGSDMNGLVSSLNQFLNYITLLEGGVSGVVMASLYKPLAAKDKDKINGIIAATDRFFRRIAFIYIVYAITIAVVYPIFVQTGYSWQYVFTLTIVLSMTLFVQYFFSLTFKLLLNADQKVYFISFSQTVIVLINMAAIVVAANIFNDIIIIKLLSAVVFVLQPILYHSYVRKHYRLDNKVSPNNDALKQRWDGFGQNLAFFVNTNTDIVVLTIFSTLTNISVYSVYLMVINALKNLIISISQAISPSMANVLVTGSRDVIYRAFNSYELVIQYITTIFFTCGIVLLTPFVMIYTNHITDADYLQPLFGMLLCIAQMIYCFRDPYVSIVYAAGRFRQTAKYAYTEALVNIIISVFMVRRFGLTGVAVGTVISMAYRMVAQVSYLKYHVLYRNIGKFVKNILVFGTSSFITVIICNYLITFNANTYLLWVCKGLITLFLSMAITTGICCAAFKSQFTNTLRGRFYNR